MQSQAEELLYQKIAERDRLEFSLCDSTDMKASVLLLLITFLAGLAASLLAEKELDTIVRSGQGFVIVLLWRGVCCVLFCVSVHETIPQRNGHKNMKDGCRNYANILQGVQTLNLRCSINFANGSMTKALERINQNYDVNRDKLKYLRISFWFLMAALGSELILLLVQSIKPLV